MHLVFTFAFVECKATMQSSCNLIQGKTKAFQGPPITIFARDKPEGNSHSNSVALDSKGYCIPSGTPPICRTIFNPFSPSVPIWHLLAKLSILI